MGPLVILAIFAILFYNLADGCFPESYFPSHREGSAGHGRRSEAHGGGRAPRRTEISCDVLPVGWDDRGGRPGRHIPFRWRAGHVGRYRQVGQRPHASVGRHSGHLRRPPSWPRKSWHSCRPLPDRGIRAGGLGCCPWTAWPLLEYVVGRCLRGRGERARSRSAHLACAGVAAWQLADVPWLPSLGQVSMCPLLDGTNALFYHAVCQKQITSALVPLHLCGKQANLAVVAYNRDGSAHNKSGSARNKYDSVTQRGRWLMMWRERARNPGACPAGEKEEPREMTNAGGKALDDGARQAVVVDRITVALVRKAGRIFSSFRTGPACPRRTS